MQAYIPLPNKMRDHQDMDKPVSPTLKLWSDHQGIKFTATWSLISQLARVFACGHLPLTSKGSTSCAMTTSCAFFCSIREVTVLTPERTIAGLLVGASGLPLARSSARARRRCCFSCLDSGLYLSNRRNSWEATEPIDKTITVKCPCSEILTPHTSIICHQLLYK